MGKRRRCHGCGGKSSATTWKDRAQPEAILRQSLANAARVTRLVREAEQAVSEFTANPRDFGKKKHKKRGRR